MSQFFANSKHHSALGALHIAVMRLSLEGYLVLGVSSKNGANVEIDRPYNDPDVKITNYPDKVIGSIDRWNCRIYWKISVDNR
jgi:hypothetical protein